MMLILKKNVSEKEIKLFVEKLTEMNLKNFLIKEADFYRIAILNKDLNDNELSTLKDSPIVEKTLDFPHQFKLASRSFKEEKTKIKIGNILIGANTFTVIAGPCSIESEEQIHHTAAAVAASGAHILRGGAFKPRTSPYDFQGIGEIGLSFLQEAAKKYNLITVSEVMDTYDVDLVAKYVDILQIGARNMQNFNLLKAAGAIGKPILLKRGFASTYKEFLMAAEYILQMGNFNIILCERGIRTFEPLTRNTLDLAAIPIVQELSHLPIIIDPSHGTGLRYAIPPMAYAAMAAGADGIMVEVHPQPDQSISDAKQAISPEIFADMMKKLSVIGSAVNKKL